MKPLHSQYFRHWVVMMNQVSSSVIILDRRSPLSFSLCWRYSAHTFSRVTLCSTVSSFGTHFAQTFLKLTSLMTVTMAGSLIPTAGHSSLFVMRPSSHISKSTWSLVSVVAGQPLWGLHQCYFHRSLKRRT